MRARRAPRPFIWLGALLILYLGYPVVAFIVRVITGTNEGWNGTGLWSAVRVSVEGATIAVLIAMVTAVPLAYILAHGRGWLSSVVGVIVQLPLAVPPLISGILLIYIIGPYTFLGRISGQRLTETMYGVVIAQLFVASPFLVVVARSAFSAVDPALGDVAATLGHGPLARFLRVDVPAASDGLRTGAILMWLRAFGEYGTIVIIAYHPYSLPVYVDNLFSSAPLSQAEAPTLIAFGIAVLAITIGRLPRPPRLRRGRKPTPVGPMSTTPISVGFDISAKVGSFRLQVAHPARGHRLAIVGPSGSGKSVTLRAVAGLLGRSAGTVTYDDADMTRIATEKRRIGYVPQGFGLLPGRTVWQQATFGVHADRERAAWWLQTLGLDGLYDRLPEELSGGQRQRVSLARALAVDPGVVLLDEPFSALDAPVRAELRRQLRRLQNDVNLSTVLVTHDPEEAAMLADEIIVLNDGHVLQAGSCREVYQRPATVQIGRLLGIDNLFDCHPPGDIPALVPTAPSARAPGGGPVLWHVPPEALRIHPTISGNGSAVNIGEGKVTDIIDLGRSVEVVVRLTNGTEIRARMLDLPALAVGSPCLVQTDADAVSTWTQSPTPEPAAAR